MTKQVQVGVIGLGGRGLGMLKSAILPNPAIKVVAVCDKYDDRCEVATGTVEMLQGYRPFQTQHYEDIIAMPEVEAIIILTSWADHINIAIAAMEQGKYVACEVGGAYSVQECWNLVEAYERTKTPIMMLENCCYTRDEMMLLNMVKQGVFGEVVHCSGGYMHDLRYEISHGVENRHYRLQNYIHRNCDNYPTHQLGPIAKVLDINKGNRMVSLVSMASKAAGLHEYVTNVKQDNQLAKVDFKQGDIVTTIIKCAGGETITLTLDTTLPRYYSRNYSIRGTKGTYNEENRSIFLHNHHMHLESKWPEQWGNVEQFREEYEHPVWQQYLQEGVREGHDGADWLVVKAFIDSVKNKTQTPIDVYDMASWMVVTALSEDSIALGSIPVAIPDFTNGKWINEKNEWK
ncbi:Gfo/Idh/MocA family protein [Paenibacillus yanchengensis]|uniref:Gfo/Idh/MocA family protein n=1 Tax=Paenibacillus yanchengensis TaxID=2035833 RepID=A0ABW4YH22_9BACL